MKSLMMDTPLGIAALLRRTAQLFGDRELVSRGPDGALRRTTYTATLTRAARLGASLRRLGLRPGDRVATLCWNHAAHLEAYFGVPSAGLVLHTLNLRLPREELNYIMGHAGDRALIVDAELHPLVAELDALRRIEHVVVVDRETPLEATLDYESLVADPAMGPEPTEPAEDAAGAICYTSGTTGRPKGIVYSHKALVVHSLLSAMPDVFGLRESDTVLGVVPMFHANAWGLPYTAALVGARQVLPGPHPDAGILLDLLEAERVTFTAAVPTVWLAVLHHLEQHPGPNRLGSLRRLVVGGAACPESLIRTYGERYGVEVVHSWGMTEMTPVGTISLPRASLAGATDEAAYEERARQGRPIPLVEVRARNEAGLVPWDGTTMGELEVRGPTVASGYYDTVEGGDAFTADGWFRTGDIVTIDRWGSVAVKDRSRDLIKSGGEWISSVALESALMGHPDVAEAAVVAIPDARWLERPAAVVVLKEGRTPTAGALRAYLGERFPEWYLPDVFEFVAEIPRTGTGKFRKTELRERFRTRPGTG